MATVKEMKPIYKVKPYVILNKENVVLHAGSFDSCFEYANYNGKIIVQCGKGHGVGMVIRKV